MSGSHSHITHGFHVSKVMPMATMPFFDPNVSNFFLLFLRLVCKLSDSLARIFIVAHPLHDYQFWAAIRQLYIPHLQAATAARQVIIACIVNVH
jgi:hypothetical protein